MKTINAIFKAISKINPNAQASMSSEDINTIVWENGTPPIPKQQILDLVPECNKLYNKELGCSTCELQLYTEELD